MGATRALLTIRFGESTVYVNDKALAVHYIDSLIGATAVSRDDDIEGRTEAVRACLTAQKSLNKVTGVTHANLGTALRDCWHTVSKIEWNAIRRLQRKGNSAKHDWEEQDC